QPRGSEQTHDLHMTAVYLFKKKNNPRDAERWVIEDLFPRKLRRPGEKVPDAMIWGRRKRAIEWGGEYSKRKLEAFHSFCKHRNYDYEIW
ncbi:MAG: hypothetical protein KC931_26845, partial [Candidatus Omnitrophica bacterium]|nr:hypothetical protein [Candidatus Omnitrophota bacterium]